MRNKLTELQWAIVVVIHTFPDYQFKYNELVAARRMAKNGWLKELKDKRFDTTKKGEEAYKNTPPRRNPKDFENIEDEHLGY